MTAQPVGYSVGNIPRAFWKHRLHCFLIVFSITAGTAIYTLLLPNTYYSAATIMNVDADRVFSGSENMLQVFGFAKEKNQGFYKFTAIINSHSFKEKLLDNLGPELFTPKEGWKGTKEALYDYALGILAGSIRMDIDPRQSNVLKIIVEMEHEQLPLTVTNRILVILQEYISDNSFTKAKLVRRYVEDSIIETKAALFETANAISDFYQTHAIRPEKSMVEAPLEKEILALNTKEGEEILGDPLLRGVLNKGQNEKTENLKKRLEGIKEISQTSYFDYLQEEYQILKGINLSLRQQYEMAKLEDVKQDLAFQILDEAKTVRRSGPRRKFYTMVGFAFSMILACFYTLLRTFFPTLPTPFDTLRKFKMTSQAL